MCGVRRRRSVLRMNWRRVGALRSFVFLLGERGRPSAEVPATAARECLIFSANLGACPLGYLVSSAELSGAGAADVAAVAVAVEEGNLNEAQQAVFCGER